MEKAKPTPTPSAGLHRLWRRVLRREALGRAPAQELLPAPGTTVGGYRLEARLGAGSFGTVYRARRGGRLYALKFLYLPQARQWAYRELQVLLRLPKPGGLCLEGYGHWPDNLPLFVYLVMEYVEGATLYEWAEQHNPSARQVGVMLRALAEELALIHAAGVVHRDLKGDNIRVRSESGQPVLVDFGVSTFPGAPDVTGPGVPGTPRYHSPEAVHFRRTRPADERYPATPEDDMWALGVVLYKLLTDVFPFDAEGDRELGDAILHHTPEAPHVLNPRVPQALGEQCLRLLARAPRERCRSAEALHADLGALLERVDTAWEVPLCEAYGPDTATTSLVAELAPEALYAHYQRLAQHERLRPRRGKPPASAALPTPPRTTRRAAPPLTGALRRLLPALLPTLGLAAVLLVQLSPHSPTHAVIPASPTAEVAAHSATAPSAPLWTPWQPGQELALQPKLHDVGGGAAIPTGNVTPAPVATATLQKESTSMKKSKPAQGQSPAKPKPARRKCDWFMSLTATAALGATACATPNLNAAEAVDPCPPGAYKAMDELNFAKDSRWESLWVEGASCPEPSVGLSMVFDQGIMPLATLRDGQRVRLVISPGDPPYPNDPALLPTDAVFSGHVRIDKKNRRLHGRITSMQSKSTGKTYPVCLYLADNAKSPGRGILDDAVKDDTVQTRCFVRVVRLMSPQMYENQ